MAVSLEWVTMPNGFRFRTICKNGVPWIEPTRFLMRHGHVGRGSSRTVDTYAERLLPFFRWVVQEELALSDVDQRGFHRFRRDLTIHDTSRPPLLKKGPDSSEVTVRSTVTMAARFLEWCGPEYHGSERPLLRVRNVPTSFRDAIGTFNSLRAGLPRAKHKLPKVLTAQQVDKCRDWIMDTYEYRLSLVVATWLALHHGLRSAEINRLTVSDILPDPAHGRHHLRVHAPNKQEDRIPIPEAALNMFHVFSSARIRRLSWVYIDTLRLQQLASIAQARLDILCRDMAVFLENVGHRRSSAQ